MAVAAQPPQPSSPVQPSQPVGAPQPVASYQQPAFAPGQAPYVPSHMGLAIFVLLCCCMPLGVVALVYAAQVKGKLAAGDFAGAQAASASSKKWAIIGIVLGVIVNAIVIVLRLPAILQEINY